MDLGAIVTIGLALVGFIGWLYRLEGRVTKEEAVRDEQVKSLRQSQSEQQTYTRLFEARIYEILERIEDKIDRKLDR